MFRYGTILLARRTFSAATSTRLAKKPAATSSLSPLLAALAATTTFALSQDSTVSAYATGAVKESAVRAAIADLIEKDAELRDDGTALTGTFVRLAWHCAGTFAKGDCSGGSDGGRMRFDPEASWGANAGLDIARRALEEVKEKFPAITYADLYTLAGVVAVEEAGGPKIPFRLGREDAASGETSPPDGRLPDADKGTKEKTISHIRDVFYRMGFNDMEIVALLGAHALGRCHPNASGYWGPWTRAETTFSNEYFRLLIEEKWYPKKTHANGRPWKGPDQFEDETGELMMLPADLALVQDLKFKKIVEKFAKDEDLFFREYAKAFSTLLELGVPFSPRKAWYQFW
eukprot:CAMPEP_0113312152 /NCGR_PEP_ID=MMETSP0010_2-20120614/9093_1 /TAXON_ID=216773 ORGANISM="Corethron hystrix, Strain 308" /NCGR_SAMPLE_ID=MMETSP0010_2 /ASSEMBLY_ACC=CAM_ASM_000155 /LENGTH=344 /DNA_ID=CAMNT_0000167913 /DNA_START=68 /DNA_END=1103 /DNA_ORIENTATION=+ /assembly_acc=CAM_ASM_000155